MKLIALILTILCSQAFAGIYGDENRNWTLLNTTDSVNAVQSGSWTTGRTWSLLNTTDSVNAVQSGTWTTGRTWSLLNSTDSVNSVQSGTWTTGRTWSLSNTTDSVTAIPVDGVKTTYSGGTSGLVFAATATDVFTIYGSASKTIRITRIMMTFTTTSGSGASVNVSLIKRSSANTGGTSTAPSVVPHDSTNAAGTATLLAYTVNPTSLGTTVGIIRSFRDALVASNSVNQLVWDFGVRPAQAIVLRGVAQGLAINLNSGSVTGSVADIDIEWTEE